MIEEDSKDLSTEKIQVWDTVMGDDGGGEHGAGTGGSSSGTSRSLSIGHCILTPLQKHFEINSAYCIGLAKTVIDAPVQ